MRDISAVFGGSGTRTWDTRSTGIKDTLWKETGEKLHKF